MTEWVTIKIPRELATEVTKTIKENPEFGFTNRNDLSKHAIIKFLMALKVKLKR